MDLTLPKPSILDRVFGRTPAAPPADVASTPPPSDPPPEPPPVAAIDRSKVEAAEREHDAAAYELRQRTGEHGEAATACVEAEAAVATARKRATEYAGNLDRQREHDEARAVLERAKVRRSHAQRAKGAAEARVADAKQALKEAQRVHTWDVYAADRGRLERLADPVRFEKVAAPIAERFARAFVELQAAAREIDAAWEESANAAWKLHAMGDGPKPDDRRLTLVSRALCGVGWNTGPSGWMPPYRSQFVAKSITDVVLGRLGFAREEG